MIKSAICFTLLISIFAHLCAIGTEVTDVCCVPENVCAEQKCDHSMLDVVILGDSNTWLGGDDCTGEKGWNKWFADTFAPATIRSYARSGATLTNTVATKKNLAENIDVLGDNNVIYNQVCRLQEEYSSGDQPEPEIVIIAAGTNDAWFVNKRPQAMTHVAADRLHRADFLNTSPAEVLTMQESVAMCCAMLRATFPSVRIVLLTPLQTVKVSVADIKKAGDLIEECGRVLNCPVIRQDSECCVRRVDELKQFLNTYDGTHTSERGARINGEYIARKVCSLLHKR